MLRHISQTAEINGDLMVRRLMLDFFDGTGETSPISQSFRAVPGRGFGGTRVEFFAKTRAACFFAPLFVMTLLGSASVVHAQEGPSVLIYCGHGGECQDGFVNMTDQLLKAGAAQVHEVSVWPVNLREYQVIIVSLPRQNFTEDEVKQLKRVNKSAAQLGGVLVLIGEYNSYSSGSIEVINTLMEDLGFTMRLNTDEIECGCEQQTTNLTDHPLTSGMDYMEFACTTSLEINDGTVLATTNGGHAFIGIERDSVVVAGDSNIFTDLCGDYDVSGNRAFFTNLLLLVR